MNTPTSRYIGHAGEQYFAWQSVYGKLSPLWDAFIWKPLISPSDEVLDFGCGGGYLTASFDCKTKCGVEINPAARAAGRRQGVDVRADISEFPEGSFTKIISSHALEHVASPHSTLIELRKRLKPGGQLILLLPLDDWRSRHQRQFILDDVHGHLHCWTPRTLGNLLLASGFTPQRIDVITHTCPPYISHILWKISPYLLHAAAVLTALFLKRRQLIAIAQFPAQT